VDRANEFERSWRGNTDPRKREWNVGKYNQIREKYVEYSKSLLNTRGITRRRLFFGR
jgi:hypothetical protein